MPYFVFAKYFHRKSSGMFEVHYKLRWTLYSTIPLGFALDLYDIWGMKQTPMLQDDNCYCQNVFMCSPQIPTAVFGLFVLDLLRSF